MGIKIEKIYGGPDELFAAIPGAAAAADDKEPACCKRDAIEKAAMVLECCCSQETRDFGTEGTGFDTEALLGLVLSILSGEELDALEKHIFDSLVRYGCRKDLLTAEQIEECDRIFEGRAAA